MGKIVAIGGGELLDNMPIHREVLRLTGVRNPKVLFIPTASYDDAERFRQFREVYGTLLGCVTDVLYLLRSGPGKREIERKIFTSQAVYVSGGNTLKMMRRWRFLGVDGALTRAHREGIVLSGISAGAICWFSYGHSDSMRFYSPERWPYIRVRGLGLVDVTFCPHYDVEKRDGDFRRMMLGAGGAGIAVDNNAALEVVDLRFRVVSAREGAGAYKVCGRQGKSTVEELPADGRARPLASLVRCQP